MADVAFNVSGLGDLDDLAGRLRTAAAGGLQAQLTRALLDAAKGPLEEVRTAWRGVQVTGERGTNTKHTGLRARVAAATNTSAIANGVRYEVNGDAVDPAYGQSLSWYLDGLGKRWRHPLYGNRSHWYGQTGQEVFFSTLDGAEARWQAGLERAMDQTIREIEG